MADTDPARALRVVTQIEAMCDFFENDDIKKAIEAVVPVTMPPAPGALGFDIPLWVGLGTVGLWAALDAFSERAGMPMKCPMPERFADAGIQSDDVKALGELDDLRHLYAHNYAGEADKEYFDTRFTRHVLKRDVSVQLTCDATFNGSRAQLDLPHLRKYSHMVKRVLELCHRSALKKATNNPTKQKRPTAI
jgi:hypothetical protein